MLSRLGNFYLQIHNLGISGFRIEGCCHFQFFNPYNSQFLNLLRSSGQIHRRLRRFKDRNSAKIPRLSEAKVEPKREGLPRGILLKNLESTSKNSQHN